MELFTATGNVWNLLTVVTRISILHVTAFLDPPLILAFIRHIFAITNVIKYIWHFQITMTVTAIGILLKDIFQGFSQNHKSTLLAFSKITGSEYISKIAEPRLKECVGRGEGCKIWIWSNEVVSLKPGSGWLVSTGDSGCKDR